MLRRKGYSDISDTKSIQEIELDHVDPTLWTSSSQKSIQFRSRRIKSSMTMYDDVTMSPLL